MKAIVAAEWLKLLHRRDAQIGLAVFGLIPIILITSLRYSEAVTFAGSKTPIALANSSLSMTLATLIGPVLVAIVTALSLARERETGELRLMLLQPYRRRAVLLGKCFTLCTYVVIGLLVNVGVGLLTGALCFGIEGTDLTLSSQAIDTLGGLLWSSALAGLGLIALVTLVLFLAVWFGFGATLVMTFGLLVSMDLVSQFEQLQPYLLTYIWNASNLALASSCSPSQAVPILLLYMGGGAALAVWFFERQDVLT